MRNYQVYRYPRTKHLHTCTGLMNLLNEQASTVMQGAFPLVAGIGLGLLFHAPYQIFTRALKPHELATGTSAFFLVRFTGATVGLVSTFPNRTFVCSHDFSRPLRVLFSTGGHREACRPQLCHYKARRLTSVT